jgi:hypothetical protein
MKQRTAASPSLGVISDRVENINMPARAIVTFGRRTQLKQVAGDYNVSRYWVHERVINRLASHAETLQKQAMPIKE